MALLGKKSNEFCIRYGSSNYCWSSFKITHFELGPLTGTVMLSVGLLTEALFCAFCFEPVDDELDWTLVYPELLMVNLKVPRSKVETPADTQGLLSQKLDAMLKEAKIDGELMSSLGNSIKISKDCKAISPTVDSISATKKIQ
jgi:gliding motility-associated protein GldL